jgi:hypothetical protein
MSSDVRIIHNILYYPVNSVLRTVDTKIQYSLSVRDRPMFSQTMSCGTGAYIGYIYIYAFVWFNDSYDI